MRVLVTGAAGFIGFHVARRLLLAGVEVIGVDNFTPYYDPCLKEQRIAQIADQEKFSLERLDISDAQKVQDLIQARTPTHVVHLAAQAGVRYSIENPFAYERSNLAGHLSILEACRRAKNLRHLVYASSSSVYGDRPLNDFGFCESDPASEPVSLYAATKRACELMSHSYALLYGIPQTGLRFFTVYGPWGRPDMAYYSFSKRILAGLPIDVYGNGQLARDFTFIDDIVDGICQLLDLPPDPKSPRILNIGDSSPVGLLQMISTLENAIGRTAQKIYLPMQPGDVSQTFANITKINSLTGYCPAVTISQGIPRFVNWLLRYEKGEFLTS